MKKLRRQKMEVITGDAEQALFKYIESIAYNVDSWECVHIAFSKLEDFFLKKHKDHETAVSQHREMAMRLVSAVLCDPLKGQEGKIFVCFDNDVFAIFRPDDEQVLEHMKSFSETFIAKDIKDIYTVYNLGQKAVDLNRLLHQKQKQAAIDKLEKANTSQKFNIFNENINIEMLERKLASRKHRVHDYILVVDDDELYTTMVKNALSEYYQVFTAATGREGIMQYIEKAPDILVLDIHLPDMDGLEILEDVMSLDRDAYVLMLSADSISENIIKAKEIGAVGFITKPFSKEKMIDSIRKCPTISTKKLKKR